MRSTDLVQFNLEICNRYKWRFDITRRLQVKAKIDERDGNFPGELTANAVVTYHLV